MSLFYVVEMDYQISSLACFATVYTFEDRIFPSFIIL